MKRIWYIHKWYRGQWREARDFRESFDYCDRMLQLWVARYGKWGWSYQISDSATEPVEARARA